VPIRIIRSLPKESTEYMSATPEQSAINDLVTGGDLRPHPWEFVQSYDG
jgi:hypothetical protein